MTDIVDKLNALTYELRAEAVVNDLINQGKNPSDLIIEYQSSHKKNYDRDIQRYEGWKEKIIIKVSRDGLFQALPEYLFIRPLDQENEKRGGKSQIRKFNEKQKEHARILFHPIENQVFISSVALENSENTILGSFNLSTLEGLQRFWNIDATLEDTDTYKLVKVIPFLPSIVGDLHLTSRCFEFFLGDSVRCEIQYVPETISTPVEKYPWGLGSNTCGESMITGGDFSEPIRRIRVSIGPIASSRIEYYLVGGKKIRLLNYLCGFFIPIEYEYEFRIVVGPDEETTGFTLNNSFLGFNTTIKQPI